MTSAPQQLVNVDPAEERDVVHSLPVLGNAVVRDEDQLGINELI